MKSTFEKMGGTYILGADGIYYPNLVSTDEEPHYGKYGMMRKTYLKEHRRRELHARHAHAGRHLKLCRSERSRPLGKRLRLHERVAAHFGTCPVAVENVTVFVVGIDDA